MVQKEGSYRIAKLNYNGVNLANVTLRYVPPTLTTGVFVMHKVRLYFELGKIKVDCSIEKRTAHYITTSNAPYNSVGFTMQTAPDGFPSGAALLI